MKNFSLKIITPPSVEPVLLHEALNQCHANSGYEDQWFIDQIRAGRELAEKYQWRCLITQTLEMWVDGVPSFPIEIPRAPLQSVVSITAYDVDGAATILDLTDFYIDTVGEPGRVILKKDKELPDIEFREYHSLSIRFIAGYGNNPQDVPDNTKSAILVYIGYAYNNRAGEVEEIPGAFYAKLSPDRVYK